MFILNDTQIADYETRKFLHIQYFDPRLLHATFYYFRLGRHYEVWDSASREFKPGVLGEPGCEFLTIPAKGYARRVMSFERFALSDRVVGQFGQVSDLAQRGLRLSHSPFLDPHFEGHLELAIENCIDRPAQIPYQGRIGKICFFDISDTYPVRSATGTVSQKKLEDRRHRDDQEDAPWADGWSQGDWR